MAGLATLACACSFSIPIGPITPTSDAVTGSIKQPSPAQLADQEDRRRAMAALATALDPQGAGTSVAWDNPTSGDRGVVTPLGHAYPDDGRICRAFAQTTRADGATTSGQGLACMETGGEWNVVSRKAPPMR